LGGSWVYVGNVSSVVNLKNTRAFSTDGDNSNNINPAVVYDNADIQKELILKDNQGKAGVYRWVNKANGNTYVGSAVNLSRRLGEYFNFNQISKGNMSINKALLKYGYSGFQLEILEYCEPSDVILREQYYIDLLVPEYNILKTAGSSFGYKHTEETLAKLKGRKYKLSEEAIARLRERALGRKHTEETIAKISASTRAAMLGRTQSEETRKKIGESMGTSVKVTDTETGITTIYPSKRQVARELNTSLDTVRRYIVSSKPFKGKYLIENLIEN